MEPDVRDAGAVYAIPAAVVILSDRPRGLALALGVLPAAIVGLPATRRGRLAVPILGTAVGVPMLVGGLLANVPVVAVIAIAAMASAPRCSRPARRGSGTSR